VEIVVITPHTDLGVALTRAKARRRPATTGPRVVINVALQSPNTLLHDGHAWKRYPPARLARETRAALRVARDADFLVHASLLFAAAAGADTQPRNPLRAIIEAVLEAEETVLAGKVPACIVRVAYMYGPESRHLRAYRSAFRLGRPYWAGRATVLQRFVHTDDAASALLAAARQRPVARILCAADDAPTSFATFMDHFARLVGNPRPLHLPAVMRPLTRMLIAEEHVQMVTLASADADDIPRPRGFVPAYADYRAGLRQVVDAWAGE
jgi:nucleoside-diphosphate-sugar epimerase